MRNMQFKIDSSLIRCITKPTGALDGKVVFLDIWPTSLFVLYLIHVEMNGKKKNDLLTYYIMQLDICCMIKEVSP